MEDASVLGEFLAAHGFRRHQLTKNRVGQFQLIGRLGGRAIDILVDTGAAATVVDLGYCRQHQLPVRDTAQVGGGAGGAHLAIYALGDVSLGVDGTTLMSAGVHVIDLTHVNHALAIRGAQPVHAVLGAEVLTDHRAVIDYGTHSLYLKHRTPEDGAA